jgi:hypothetical protein
MVSYIDESTAHYCGMAASSNVSALQCCGRVLLLFLARHLTSFLFFFLGFED